MIVVVTLAVVVIRVVVIVRACDQVLRAGWVMSGDHPLQVACGPHRRAQHRRRERTPDREQYSKQNEQS